mmetsp:Transcript_1739/g.2640  ORF Transcript_1739/g.2640 Transcript_1739/m.2640 type:complete len:128 (+) Transcript_1739:119-502(+)|eukprot:CAMPEP_0194200222 /NCGR_PEP_ID=MMETSP0156-20130528/924_1 /TAXON_ID=33649 /ORGANISM="Thalassionema nitzschioides, Strain L26-B" /LENGTH=127 /DNA_ID=CAMNT_0038925195 /DNA_START=12 /DNA_END=395 /DNA_ORIENTATION=+
MNRNIYFFILVIEALERCHGFAVTQQQAHFRGTSVMSKRDDAEYLARLQEAAKDPKAFERFVAGDYDKEEKKEPVKNKGGGGYQRIEEWDEQSKQNLSWEEKVQFDGQRFGNQFNQNEILRKNLKSY